MDTEEIGGAAKKLNVASWPGRSGAHNPFINIFLDGLDANGCRIQDLETVEALANTLKEDTDILLLHWAERVFGESRNRCQILMKIRRLLLALGKTHPHTRVVWVVHNLSPHDARSFQRLVWPRYIRALARKVDAFITLAPGTVEQVKNALPELADTPSFGAWHPAYPNAQISADDRKNARAKLGFNPENRVLGYCGQIRPYKGVEDLIDAFRQTTAQDLRLLLCGRAQSGTSEGRAFLSALKAKAAKDDRIVLWFDDLTETEFRSALSACDVVVAPFRSYLHSGSIVHALSANRPVLTPETPFAKSLEGLLGSQWVRQYKHGLNPELLTKQESTTGTINLSPLAPNVVGKSIVSFLRGLSDEPGAN